MWIERGYEFALSNVEWLKLPGGRGVTEYYIMTPALYIIVVKILAFVLLYCKD